jgi:hypothetical protein
MTDDHETVIAAAMDEAEEVHDPLDGLVMKTSSWPIRASRRSRPLYRSYERVHSRFR